MEHQRCFLYQLLRGLTYLHSGRVYHRDLKPKNLLVNSDCKLKICDFGLARASVNAPSAIYWTDYVATRWYRAPELCGSFFAKYTAAIDIWSVGCIFGELLLRKPLFPGKNVAHQLELITDLLGTPAPQVLAKIRNEKSKKYLLQMQDKPGVEFGAKFPAVDPAAIRLLKRLLEFDPAARPSAEEALQDPYFTGLPTVKNREQDFGKINKMEFEFDRRKLSGEEVRNLIYREALEYHPGALKTYIESSISQVPQRSLKGVQKNLTGFSKSVQGEILHSQKDQIWYTSK